LTGVATNLATIFLLLSFAGQPVAAQVFNMPDFSDEDADAVVKSIEDIYSKGVVLKPAQTRELVKLWSHVTQDDTSVMSKLVTIIRRSSDAYVETMRGYNKSMAQFRTRPLIKKEAGMTPEEFRDVNILYGFKSEKVGGLFSGSLGALSTAANGTGLVVGASDLKNYSHVLEGLCPSGIKYQKIAKTISGSGAVADDLLDVDLAERDKAVGACDGKLNFDETMKSAENTEHWGWTTQCDGNGTVNLFYKNGVKSVIHFVKNGSEVSPDSISTSIPSDTEKPRDAIGVIFSPNGDKWFVTDKDGRPDTAWNWKASVRKYHQTMSNKFEDSLTPNEKRAKGLITARRALGMVNGKEINFNSACQGLGGKVPTGEISYDSVPSSKKVEKLANPDASA
jgi:hypothetical protein